MRRISLTLIALAVTACGTPVTTNDVANAYYGSKPSATVTTPRIRSYLSGALVDPDSLRLRCADPRKGWAKRDMVDTPSFGYVVLCGVNAKNRLGGYAGEEAYIFLFNNSDIAMVTNKARAGSELQKGREYNYVE